MSATSPIHQREQYAALKRGLGRIADHAVAGTDTPQGPALRLVHAPAPSDDARFPVGAQTRKLDAAGRVKLRWDSASVAELLGWGPGLLDAVCHDGWLVLTQRDDLVNAKPGSNSSFASITNAGTANERIALRGAHLHHLGVADGDHLLLAPLPDAGALVLTNPCRLAAFASEQVLALIAGDDD
ncbi:MAG: hypothetical protein KDB37_04480 [Ilumatobacter sp.]|nr:hypothetical protein [Ilumatobacter sp.]